MQDMLVNCNSCQKKFVVPDSAITEKGRLLQCGSCGNKWTQFPIEQKEQKFIKEVTNIESSKKTVKQARPIKKASNTKKREINLYSEEYLKKKHGLVIKNAISTNSSNLKRNSNTSIGFYGNLIILFIILITFFGVLDLNKNLLINKFPFLEAYIDHFYDILEMFKESIKSLLN